jgi:sulfatase modifying factor 1
MYRFAVRTSCFVLCLVIARDASAVVIDTVLVGNAGNEGKVESQGTFGAVPYDFRIGTTEVTNAQYVEFLNAKAASDPLSLFHSNMSLAPLGGIRRNGASPNFTYATIPGKDQMPVTSVSWYDTLRFVNWLHNGQGDSDTETGAYTLLGNTETPSNGNSITRNAGARWFLPSENEWFKAAYHKNDGVTGNFFAYPTGSDVAPVAEPPPGGNNSANYGFFALFYLAEVGSYTATSPYGAFDIAGYVYEWNESVVNNQYRNFRGGSMGDNADKLLSSDRGQIFTGSSNLAATGFRVGAIVPEPRSWNLAILALALIYPAARFNIRRKARVGHLGM